MQDGPSIEDEDSRSSFLTTSWCREVSSKESLNRNIKTTGNRLIVLHMPLTTSDENDSKSPRGEVASFFPIHVGLFEKPFELPSILPHRSADNEQRAVGVRIQSFLDCAVIIILLRMKAKTQITKNGAWRIRRTLIN